MIELRNICKRFGRQQVLQDISVTFGASSTIALIGPNGCGKTTMIKTILGMVLPEKGELYIDGKHIVRDVQYREDIGYMPQISRFPENMTIDQLFVMMQDIRRAHQGKKDWYLYESFALETIKHKKLKTLSGGTRQKVSAALAFLFNPRILILDEPTAGLDPLSVEILKEKIRAVKAQGRLVLLTSHILSDLDDIVTDIVYVLEGNIVFHKPYQELLDETGEVRLSKAIASIMISHGHIPQLRPSHETRA